MHTRRLLTTFVIVILIIVCGPGRTALSLLVTFVEAHAFTGAETRCKNAEAAGWAGRGCQEAVRAGYAPCFTARNEARYCLPLYTNDGCVITSVEPRIFASTPKLDGSFEEVLLQRGDPSTTF